MDEPKRNFISAMPDYMKPEYSKTAAIIKVGEITTPPGKGKRKSWRKIIVWVIVLVIAMVALVQYINAAKYGALVQVIKEDKIGVNPTGERLDFGDLPHNKDAVRTVTLASGGKTGSYIIVWKFGAISDLIKVDKNYFTLKPGTMEKLEFTVHIPNSAEYKYYKGKIIIFQIPKIW